MRATGGFRMKRRGLGPGPHPAVGVVLAGVQPELRQHWRLAGVVQSHRLFLLAAVEHDACAGHLDGRVRSPRDERHGGHRSDI